MRALLVTTGSHGDIHPFIAIARALQAAGDQATIATNPYFRAQIEREGIAFQPIGEHIDLTRIGELYPDVMHPRRGIRTVMDVLIGGFAVECLQTLRPMLERGRFDLVAHHHIAMGAAWAADQARVPRASVVLSPMCWMAQDDPICPVAEYPVRPGPFARWLLRTMQPAVLWWTVERSVARTRRRLGLPKVPRDYTQITRGGLRNLGMWSTHFRGPCADDPATGRICGFPWHDRIGAPTALDPAIERFLEAGEPPLLFCLGTAAVHVAGDFYEEAARACAAMKRRGIFLVGAGREAPRALPAGSIALPYAPFGAVMPRCAATVHHGGIGSTAQALRAGRPMLVIPHAHDQFDNAARAVRLGVARSLPRGKVNARTIARELEALLADAAAAKRAATLGPSVGADDGGEQAAQALRTMRA